LRFTQLVLHSFERNVCYSLLTRATYILLWAHNFPIFYPLFLLASVPKHHDRKAYRACGHILKLGTRGELSASGFCRLTSGKGTKVSTGWEVRWTPVSIWTWWGRESHTRTGNKTPVAQPTVDWPLLNHITK